jgi:tetratricopeptide (TPR) repeat protein
MTFSRVVGLCAIALMFWSCGRAPEEKRDHFVELGDKYYEQEDYNEASIFYRKALQYDRRHAGAYYKLGLASWEMSRAQQAVNAFQRAFELDRDNLDAFRKLGELYYASSFNQSSSKNKAAIDALVRLTELAGETHPTAKEVLYMKGQILIANERYKEALPYLEQAAELDRSDASIALSLAGLQGHAGQLEAAEATAKAILDSTPTDARFYDFLYRLYASRGRADDAEEILITKTKILPDQSSNWIALSSFYRSQGKEDQAKEPLQHLVDNSERFPEAWATIGDYYVSVGDIEEAVRAYREGLKNQPEREQLYDFRIIYAYLSSGDLATASQAIDKILEEDDEDYRAIGLRGMLHLMSGDASQFDLALKDLKTATVELPDNIPLKYQYGRALLQSGDPMGAEEHLRDAIQQDPRFLPARYSLLDLHLSQGEFPEAEVVAEQLLEELPLDASARLALAIARMGLGRYDDARQNLLLILEHKERLPDAVWQIGKLDLMEGKLAEAEHRFRALSEADPPDRRGAQGLLEVYIAQNRLEDAGEIVERELGNEPDNNDLRILAARLAMAGENSQKAKDELREVLRREPTNGQANRYLAEIVIAEGDRPAAMKYFKTAIEATPPIPEAFFRYGTLLQRQGDSQGARKHLLRCIELMPDHSDALNNLAYVLADLEMDLSMAVTYAQRAVARQPENHAYSDTLGYVYIKRRLYQNAVDVLEAAVKGDPERGDYRYHYALALYHAGQKEKAAQELRAAQALELSSQDASGVKTLLEEIGD